MSTLYSASHPWMRALSRKRTHSSDDTNSDDDAPAVPVQVQRYPRTATTTPPPPTAHARKRFRASGLEGTLAKLSLTPPPPPAPRLYPHDIPDLDASNTSQSAYDDDLDMAVEDESPLGAPPNTHSFAAPLPPNGAFAGEGDMLRNGAVEEPLPEIRMRATSWYEPTPDRIIVTDLDGSDADDEREDHTEPVILPSALELLQKRLGASVPVLPRDEAQRLALVPFRPPVFRAPASLGFEDQAGGVQRGVVVEEDDVEEAGSGRNGEGEVDGGVLADEEDGMDVEPMDVEL
ncbi:hypothetical protein PENSPDRAFT_687147 [Peniophora sp. CONT]|nr:hypothetical protein PENSPDRAFT_687147 [Peniophora sp. CONT]